MATERGRERPTKLKTEDATAAASSIAFPLDLNEAIALARGVHNMLGPAHALDNSALGEAKPQCSGFRSR